MAHFCELDSNNVVVQVIVVNNKNVEDLPFPESEPLGIQFLIELFGEGKIWKQTSYNRNFRNDFGRPGFIYDPQADAFYAPKPFPSWIYDSTKKVWAAPIPTPDKVKPYKWDEAAQSWVEVPQ